VDDYMCALTGKERGGKDQAVKGQKQLTVLRENGEIEWMWVGEDGTTCREAWPAASGKRGPIAEYIVKEITTTATGEAQYEDKIADAAATLSAVEWADVQVETMQGKVAIMSNGRQQSNHPIQIHYDEERDKYIITTRMQGAGPKQEEAKNKEEVVETIRQALTEVARTTGQSQEPADASEPEEDETSSIPPPKAPSKEPEDEGAADDSQDESAEVEEVYTSAGNGYLYRVVEEETEEYYEGHIVILRENQSEVKQEEMSVEEYAEILNQVVPAMTLSEETLRWSTIEDSIHREANPPLKIEDGLYLMWCSRSATPPAEGVTMQIFYTGGEEPKEVYLAGRDGKRGPKIGTIDPKVGLNRAKLTQLKEEAARCAAE
jgi:hypothetical protein